MNAAVIGEAICAAHKKAGELGVSFYLTFFEASGSWEAEFVGAGIRENWGSGDSHATPESAIAALLAEVERNPRPWEPTP